MKILNTFSILFLVFFFTTCKAQTILPLNTYILDVPNGAYLKDTNNELDAFVGIYRADYDNKETTLYITKEINKLMKSGNVTFYSDALIIKFVIKNSSGQILQDTQNLLSLNNEFYSIGMESNKAGFTYKGSDCNAGRGIVYLKKINLTQFTWEYLPQENHYKNCPPGTNTTIYLPITKDLFFTKQ